MDHKEIVSLIKLVDKSDIGDVHIKEGDFEIRIKNGRFTKQKVVTETTPTVIATPVAPTVQTTPAVAAPETQTAANPAPVQDVPAVTDSSEGEGNYLEVRSPIVGTFYRSPAPDKPPYVKVGDTISQGDVVCIIEAMKLFNEIESEISGKVAKVMVEDASPVEYDQVLFLLEPA